MRVITPYGKTRVQPSGYDDAISIRKNSTGSLFTRRIVNLIEGSGATLTVADDDADDEIDVTVASAGGTNALLDGTNHTDTAASTVTRGDIIVGNATPAWSELAIGAANALLGSDGTDVAWFGCTAAGRAILDDADAAAQRTTLGLGDAMIHQGLVDGTLAPANFPAADRGHLYYVDGTGTIGGLDIKNGDFLICHTDGTISGDYATVGTNWALARTAVHKLLESDRHNDTVDATCSRGSLIIGNSDPFWSELTIGAANALLGSDGTDVAWFGCTAAGRAILDDADAAAQRTTLGLGTLATQSGTFSGTSSGTNTGDQVAASQAEQETATDVAKFVSPGRQQFHPSAAKGWAAWEEVGTWSTLASYNVSSITDLGTGLGYVNWDVDFSTDYCVIAWGDTAVGADTGSGFSVNEIARAATRWEFRTNSAAGTAFDYAAVCVVAFGDQ